MSATSTRLLRMVAASATVAVATQCAPTTSVSGRDNPTPLVVSNQPTSPVVPDNSASSAAATEPVITAQSLTVDPASAGGTYSDPSATSRTALAIWDSSSTSATQQFPASSAVVVRAMGKPCQGDPIMTVSLDGITISTTTVSTTEWTNFSTAVSVPHGSHTVSIGFTNPYFGSCTRTLMLDSVTMVSASPAVFDDFAGPAGSAPNPQYWGYDTGRWSLRDELETYTNSADNVRLDGQGNLIIQALKTATGYTSGRLTTRGKVNMLYGTMSARIKLPSGQGIWPGFWLLGSNVDSAGWPQCGEIDVIELVNTGTNYHITIHGPQGNTDYLEGAGVEASGPIPDLTNDFHTYWVTRQPNSITAGIDGSTLAHFTPTSLPSGAQWVFEHPFYAILNVAVGGDWPGPPDNTTQFPATMLVNSFAWNPT